MIHQSFRREPDEPTPPNRATPWIGGTGLMALILDEGVISMQRIPLQAALAMVLILVATVCHAADEPANQNADAKKAIEKIMTTYRQALGEGNAEALAGLWTPDGDFVDCMGRLVRGREAIRKEFEQFFAEGNGVKARATEKELRFLRPDVALLEGVVSVVPAPKGPPGKIRFFAILVRQDDQWQIQSVRQSLIPIPSNYPHLKELAWMVGRWSYQPGSSKDEVVRMECKWGDSKSYLLRRFTMKLKNGIALSGTQRIGWDPAAKTIRSWVFDSNGTFAESVWTRDGNCWMVQEAGVLHDGRRVSATNLVTRVDDDTFTFESVDRLIEGEPASPIAKIELKRVKDR